ncbi:hypothetical protein A3A66_01570 [Microgenomates group bacterium RIFCSPLOWO2_01_FULL_46_13]|nr:MAG: hypothetical protein A3A66_01570 [Microgenomates group bacterium RIFCSPLOWO2_01_FULL_46_13]
MINLDSRDEIRQIDSQNVLGSVEKLADQCEQAWREVSATPLPRQYSQARNIVVCGMGGSRFTPLAIRELFRDRISVPYDIVDGYHLPGYVNSDTLVILSSYSGTTEEVLVCAEEALKRKALITGITAGGKVAEFLSRHTLPGYIFVPRYNPCGQPRVGGGYMLMGHLGMLTKLGYVKVAKEEVAQAIEMTRKFTAQNAVKVTADKNFAKQVAEQLRDRHVFVITAEFLRGFGNGFANQINETAKLISDPRYIPELNHHLIEGLQRPESLNKNGLFLFVFSSLYSDPIKKRFTITKEVVEKQRLKTWWWELTGSGRLAQLLEAFTVSGFVTFYLALLYGTNPVEIPWVDYFKKRLAE